MSNLKNKYENVLDTNSLVTRLDDGTSASSPASSPSSQDEATPLALKTMKISAMIQMHDDDATFSQSQDIEEKSMSDQSSFQNQSHHREMKGGQTHLAESPNSLHRLQDCVEGEITPISTHMDKKQYKFQLAIGNQNEVLGRLAASEGTSGSASRSVPTVSIDEGRDDDVTISPPPLSLRQQVFLSAYWFGWSFLWLALLVVVIPTQISDMTEGKAKGLALSSALFFGALISIIATPLFGSFSDTRSPTAWLGKRKAFMVIGSIICSGSLVLMANANHIATIAAGFFILSLSNNIIMAPYVALVPDLTPPSQRGSTSGWLGTFSMAGYLCAGLVTYNLSGIGIGMVYLILGSVHLLTLIISVIFVREYSFLHEYREREYASREKKLKKKNDQKKDENLHFEKNDLSSMSNVPVGSLPMPFSPTENKLCGDVEMETRYSNVSSPVDSFSRGSDPFFAAAQQRALTKIEKRRAMVEHFVGSGLFQKSLKERIGSFWLPFKAHNFRMVFISRFFVQMGIITVQEYIQFFLADVFSEYKVFGMTFASNVEQAVSIVFIPVLIGALLASVVAGFASDSHILTRKAQLGLSGGLMSSACLLFAFTSTYAVCLLSGLLFGLGYGMFSVLDWTIVTEALPASKSHATDMGIWSLSLIFPQVLATPIAGVIIDSLSKTNPRMGYTYMFIITVAYIVIGLGIINFVTTTHGLVPPSPVGVDEVTLPPLPSTIDRERLEYHHDNQHHKLNAKLGKKSQSERALEQFTQGCTRPISLTGSRGLSSKVDAETDGDFNVHVDSDRVMKLSTSPDSHISRPVGHLQQYQSQHYGKPHSNAIEIEIETTDTMTSSSWRPTVSNNFEIDDEDDLTTLDVGDYWNNQHQQYQQEQQYQENDIEVHVSNS